MFGYLSVNKLLNMKCKRTVDCVDRTIFPMKEKKKILGQKKIEFCVQILIYFRILSYRNISFGIILFYLAYN